MEGKKNRFKKVIKLPSKLNIHHDGVIIACTEATAEKNAFKQLQCPLKLNRETCRTYGLYLQKGTDYNFFG